MAALHNQRAYFPQLRQLAFFEEVARHLGSPDLVIQVGSSAKISEYGAFGECVTRRNRLDLYFA